ncbi:hypothetical protein BV22DRAFT_1052835, partial [Leucogyrophana mollusca]
HRSTSRSTPLTAGVSELDTIMEDGEPHKSNINATASCMSAIANAPALVPVQAHVCRRHSRKIRGSDLEVVWHESSGNGDMSAPPAHDTQFNVGDLYIHFPGADARDHRDPQIWYRTVSRKGTMLWVPVTEGYPLPDANPRRYLRITATDCPSWIKLSSVPKLLGDTLLAGRSMDTS